MGGVDRFSFSGSCPSPGSRKSEEVFPCIRKARLAFTDSRHFRRWRDIQSWIKGRVHTAAMKWVSLNGSKPWPLKAEDLRRLSVLEHRFLRSTCERQWESRVSNLEVGCKVTSSRVQSSDQAKEQDISSGLEHILSMPTESLLRFTLFLEVGNVWKIVRGGRSMTREKCLKALTSGLFHEGTVKLMDCGP